jgi:hypothetical protein
MMPDAPDPFVLPWIEHGTQRLRIERPRIQSRSREIDTTSVSYQDERDNVFPIDSVLDGFPGLRIVEREVRPDGPVYQYRLSLEGLLSGTWRETGYEEDLPEEGWDSINLNVYTSTPSDARWRKGSRIEMDSICGVSAVAATGKFSFPEHGLITGQTIIPEFTTGFGGVTADQDYFVCRLNANQFFLGASKANALAATITPPSAPSAITGNHTSGRIAWVAHGLSDGEVVTFPTLTGGIGLTAVLVPYYVLSSTVNDFQLALTPGGAAVPFGNDITAGTCRTGSVLTLTSDGSNMRVRPIKPGFELCWIMERRKRKSRAKDYWELDLQLKGLKQGDDDSKLIKRRISTTGQTVSNDTYNGQTISAMYLGFPPQYIGTYNFAAPVLGQNISAEFDLPQISVTDTMITTAPPPTQLVPGYWVPADPPRITVFSAFSDDYTYHCPSGWKVLSMQSEQIPGKPLWLLTITWGYQMAKSPKTTPATP